VESSAVHGWCGIWGVLALGFFHTEKGCFMGGDGNLLGWQIAGAITIAVWAGFMSGIFFFLEIALFCTQFIS